MSEQDLISVIVPVYNAEKYLDRGLASLAAQTHKNIEKHLLIILNIWFLTLNVKKILINNIIINNKNNSIYFNGIKLPIIASIENIKPNNKNINSIIKSNLLLILLLFIYITNIYYIMFIKYCTFKK